MLKQGVSIAVSADKNGDHTDESVGKGIKNGCIYLGHFYVRRTKEPLLFYPVHISRKRREIAVGSLLHIEKQTWREARFGVSANTFHVLYRSWAVRRNS